jgi:hypothetical protein
MRIKLLLLCATFTVVGCGSSSPENYVKTSTRIGCRYYKKCEKDLWDEAGFDNVRDCVNQTLDTEVAPGLTLEDAFVEGCEDFDSSAARKCLAGMRKVTRTCDEDAASDDQEKACGEVCGRPSASALFSDPSNPDLALRLLEELEAEGALD